MRTCFATAKIKRIAFVTGHPEYDAFIRVKQNIFATLEAGLNPEVPYNHYFPKNDPQNIPRATSRKATVIYFVYQLLNYWRLPDYAI